MSALRESIRRFLCYSTVSPATTRAYLAVFSLRRSSITSTAPAAMVMRPYSVGSTTYRAKAIWFAAVVAAAFVAPAA